VATILIAEDEADIRNLVKLTLEIVGHTVLTVTNGEEAVQNARTELPDLVLLDVRMPRMNGMEACKAIKADEVSMHIPVAFLSGNEDVSEREKMEAAGAVGFIPKPFEPIQLQGIVASLLKTKGTG
jgi:CheY-like chemotaxis protein